mgnify:CR=1 FL=1
MRLLILLAGLVLAGGAFADQQHDIRVNRIEMKAAAPDQGDDAEESKEKSSQTKAQDYNSSRSNTTSAIETEHDLEKDEIVEILPMAGGKIKVTVQRGN